MRNVKKMRKEQNQTLKDLQQTTQDLYFKM